MPEHDAVRAAHFQRDHLTWIAVRHFLSADLLEELARAIVEVVTRGRSSLDDLFDMLRTSGPPLLVTWAAQPRQVTRPVDRFLQNVITSLVWTGDERPGADGKGVDPFEAERLKAIDAAFEVARLDFESLAPVRARESLLPSLHPLLEVVARVAASADDADADDVIEGACASIAAQIARPLDAIVVKHLGDLCADADRWRLASEFYSRSADLLATQPDDPWSSLTVVLRNVVAQSQAAARWSLEGADAALQAYDALSVPTGLEGGPVPSLNAAIDAMNAHFKSTLGVPSYDFRPFVALAPQVLDTHDLAGALSLWRGEEYGNAHRRFWATLRRQTALGSASASRTTKAFYGSAIIDGLRAEVGRHLEPASFLQGVRLLVESGRENVADRIVWTERLVAENVDKDLLAHALARARGAPGIARERMSVVLTLFKHWVLVLPRDATKLATSMLTALADAAGDAGSADRGGMAGIALKGLSAIGEARPEFVRLASGAVSDAIVRQLDDGGVIGAGDALRFAFESKESFGESELTALANATLRLLGTFEPAQSPWPIVRPAIALLGSRRVLALCEGDEALKATLPVTLVTFALESETEHSSLMYLLRDLDPDWLEGRVDPSRLALVIEGLRKRAGAINSSRAPDDVLALLVAPAISKADGVRAALGALRRMVDSGATERPAISFERAYKAVMLIADARTDLALEAGLPEDEVREASEAIATSLLGVWERAAVRPLVFAGFSIPPRSAPNSVLVHNWAFASLGLARSIGREPEMAKVLDLAAHAPSLENAIAVARAIRAGTGDLEPVDVDAIRREGKEAFYASVGRRLMLLNGLPADARDDLTQALLEQCVRLGPHGLDAGVFLAAVLHWPSRALSEGDLQIYRRRLDNSNELRMGLAPLIEEVRRLGGVRKNPP